MKNTLFSGCVNVLELNPFHQYKTFAILDKEGHYGYTDVTALDDIMIDGKEGAWLELQYPFDRPLKIQLDDPEGYSVKKLIDAVRRGFYIMYTGTSATPIPGLINQTVIGHYGQAFHVIEDLVIESLRYDEDTHEVEVGIGS